MPLAQRRSPRLKNYDYSLAGGYFVTICTDAKKHCFGNITDSMMLLSELGQIAHHHWLKTPEFFPTVQLSDYIVMPNHVHLILFLSESHNKLTKLGHIIGNYKAGVTRRARLELDYSETIWQSSYHEHLIRNEADLNRIREYVQTNPAQWEAETFYAS